MALQLLPRPSSPNEPMVSKQKDANIKEPKDTEYFQRKEKEEKSWIGAREKLRQTFVKQQFLPSESVCVEYKQNNQPRKVVCRCLEYGWGQLFCLDCATAVHRKRNCFHVLDLWKVSYF